MGVNFHTEIIRSLRNSTVHEPMLIEFLGILTSSWRLPSQMNCVFRIELEKVWVHQALDLGKLTTVHAHLYYNLPYNPSAPFVRSGYLVSYRIRSAMKFSQNVLHYIWHTSRVYVIHIKSLSRYFQLTQNWTDKAKWRSIEASNIVHKHTGHGLLAVNSPSNKFRFS